MTISFLTIWKKDPSSLDALPKDIAAVFAKEESVNDGDNAVVDDGDNAVVNEVGDA